MFIWNNFTKSLKSQIDPTISWLVKLIYLIKIKRTKSCMFTMCVLACQLLSLECVFYADQLNTITTKDEGVNKVLFLTEIC